MELLSGVVDGGAAAVLGRVDAINVCCWCVMSPAPKCRFHGAKQKVWEGSMKSVGIKRLR